MFLTFTVHGIPQTQGSKQAFPYVKGRKPNGKPLLGVRVVEDNPKTIGWRADVSAAAAVAMFDSGRVLTTAPVRLEVDLYLPRPAGHFGTGRNRDRLKPAAPIFHTQTPDSTKLLRAVEDAMKGIVWKDDSQVCDSHARKFWTRTTGFAVVIIHEIDTQAEIEAHFRGSRGTPALPQPALL